MEIYVLIVGETVEAGLSSDGPVVGELVVEGIPGLVGHGLSLA
jgi:hypothetical protein